MRISKGFSLIELMIVVGIIGILVIMAYPYYKDYMVRIKITETVASGSVVARKYLEDVINGDGSYLTKELGLPSCAFDMSNIDWTGNGFEVGSPSRTKDIGIPHARACQWAGLILVLNKDEFPFKNEKIISFIVQPNAINLDPKYYSGKSQIMCGQRGMPFGKFNNVPRRYLPLGCRDYTAIFKEGALDWTENLQ